MKSTTPYCLRAGSSSLGRTSADRRLIDSRTTQALHQLRLHGEELALELAVRLRVLGKSLEAACQGREAVVTNRMGSGAAYTKLRRQLDVFFGSLANGDLAGQHHFPAVREYIQKSLPVELSGCAGAESCRIVQMEEVVLLLSESPCEDEAFPEEMTLSYSL